MSKYVIISCRLQKYNQRKAIKTMKKIFKTVAAVATAATLTMSLVGCSLIVDKDDIEKLREEQALDAQRAQQAKETILTIDGDIQVSGAYYGYYFSNSQMKMTQEAQQAQEAEAAASSDAQAESSAEIKLDIEEVKADAKEQIVAVKMACKKAQEAGIKLTDEDKVNINQQVDDFKSQIQQMGLSQAGITYNDYITDFLYTNQETIEEIMKDAYIANLYNASLVADKFVSAKHILIEFPAEGAEAEEGKPATKEEALKEITEIKKQLDGGADFDKLMNEKSTDPGLATAPEGYTFAKGAMVPEFEAAAFALKEGEISDIVETSYGYHILKKVPTTASAVANALGSTADPEVASVIEESSKALTEGVDVVESEKISYYKVD